MRKNKKMVSVIAFVLAALMVVGILASLFFYATESANAASVSELESQKAQAEQELNSLKSEQSGIASQKSELQAKIDTLEAESADYAAQKEALDAQVTLTLDEIANIEAQLATYETLISEKEVELQEAQDEQAAQLERYKKRIRTMEEDRDLSYISVLFSSDNFSELLNKVYEIQEIIEFDKAMSEELEAAAKAVEDAKTRLEETKAELDAKKVELEETKAELQANVDAAEAKITELSANIASSQTDLDALAAEEARVEADISSKTQSVAALDSSIQDAIAAAEAAAAAAKSTTTVTPTTTDGSNTTPTNNTPASTGNGTFIWPCAGGTITSNYGYRIHPISGTSKLHAGMDIGASTGTAIYAAAGGQVVTAEYSSSYGNYVLINHGNGVYTLYAHSSKLYVSAGETVYQGQTIAAVGSTGNSTGPHLHFEVRINGSTVDPAGYL